MQITLLAGCIWSLWPFKSSKLNPELEPTISKTSPGSKSRGERKRRFTITDLILTCGLIEVGSMPVEREGSGMPLGLLGVAPVLGLVNGSR
jgi:hypothetical protein